MAAELVKELVDAGIHFGHRVSRWNPKMKPYLYGKRNLIHIINVKETLKGILLAKKFIAQTVADGKDLLIVGTKRQARKAVQEHAERIGMHWVNDRWLGGALTNFREIRKRVTRLDELEKMEAEGLLDAYSKKQGASLRREMRKIRRNLQGIRKMEKFPGVVFCIDQQREVIAIREAQKAGIPVICLLDTDSDPDMVDIPIPGNDDAMRCIELVVKEMCDAVEEGLRGRVARKDDQSEEAPRRRSRRSTTARADGHAGIAAVETLEPDASAATPAAPAESTAAAPAPAEPAVEAPSQDESESQ